MGGDGDRPGGSDAAVAERLGVIAYPVSNHCPPDTNFNLID